MIMATLAALLDLPGYNQFTRIRLIVRNNEGELWTSGTTGNCRVSEQEFQEFQDRGFAFRWENRFERVVIAGPNGGHLLNPTGFWMGKDVLARQDLLASFQRFPVPVLAREISQRPWEGRFWIEDAAQIQQKRRRWVELLARHAMQSSGSERTTLWQMMLATLPGHELTRAVKVAGLSDEEARHWLRRQIAAEGKLLTPAELDAYLEQLKQQSQMLAARRALRKERQGVRFAQNIASHAPPIFQHHPLESA
jgi:hypothetical protein